MRICPECNQKTDQRACPRDGTPTIDESLLRESPDPLIGRVLVGRYRVLEALGQGAMGRVYIADQMVMKRRVALKVIRAETLGPVADRLNLIRRFQREALAASRLKHPNTVQVHDYGNTEDGILFLAMELLEGRTLAKVLHRERRLRPERVVRIGIQVCRGLSEAHDQGVVHRDLKPENIMLTRMAGEEDFVKVLDFGIAKVALPGTGDSALTHSGIVLGTPVYMAPEQGLGQKVGPAADLYSLGVILYEALSGRLPFQAETALGVMMRHAHDPVPPLIVNGDPPDVPPLLEQLVMALLAKKPEDRPGSALEVASLLEASLGHGVRKVREEGGEDDTTVHWPGRGGGDDADTANLAIEELERRRKRRRFFALAGAGVAVAGAAVMAITVLGGRGPDRVPVSAVDAGLGVVTADVGSPSPEPGFPVAAGARDAVREPPSTPAMAGREPEPGGVAEARKRDSGTERPVPKRPKNPRDVAPLPTCASLRCPFTRECVGTDGKRTTGENWCPPVF